MYAIVELGGRQVRVEPGTRFETNRVGTAVGQAHAVDRVLLAHDGRQLQVGRPYVAGAQVVCEVVAHHLGPKTIAYHYRRRENWRKTVGHRQPLTRLLVKDIVFGGAPAAAASAAAQPAGKPAAARAAKPRAARAPAKRPPAKKE
jgi:large subunit ribosomal protein L21